MLLHSPVTPGTSATRIVSLVPSITELLAYFDLDAATIGITKFCVHPEAWFRNKTRIGGTKDFHPEKIISLKPDLVLCNKEENSREPVEWLAESLPVYLSDVETVDNAFQMIRDIGILTGKEPVAARLIGDINTAFGQLPSPEEKIRTAYLIWKDPYMTVGGDTFISEMMNKAGLENVFSGSRRYPTIGIDELIAADPQLILLSSEPYPFIARHIGEIQVHLPATTVLTADGEMFSWYGSRMRLAPAYFSQLLSQIQLS